MRGHTPRSDEIEIDGMLALRALVGADVHRLKLVDSITVVTPQPAGFVAAAAAEGWALLGVAHLICKQL